MAYRVLILLLLMLLSVVGPGDKLESLQSAADRLGFKVLALRKKIASGELPAYRITEKPGAAIRVKVSDVNALLKPVLPQQETG